MASTFTVERSRTVAAPPERVHALVDDFHAWTRWSPWEGIDPSMTRTYSGAESGVGAAYAWSGNRKAGQGRMEITESVPGSRVVVALEFQKPFRSSNVTTFTFTPEGAGTRVLWSMTGPRPLLMRALSFVLDPEKMVGPDFERGLAQLDEAARA